MSANKEVNGSYVSIYEIPFDATKPFTRLQINSVLNFINRASVVLDVGAADGRFLKYFSPKIKSGVGLDIDNVMIEKAVLNSASISNLTFVQGDCLNLPFDKNSFDVSYCFAVLVICGNIEVSISEMKRVTKKDGMLILDIPNRHSLTFLRWRKYYEKSELHYFALSPKQSLALLEKLQLEVVRIQAQGFLTQVMYLPFFGRLSKIFDTPLIAKFDIWLSSKFLFKSFSSRWITICKVMS